MFCPNCGKNISEFALSCPFCGNTPSSQEHDSAPAEQKAVTGAVSAKKYTVIVIATLISLSMLFLCQWIFAGCYSVFGADMQSSIITTGWIISVRSILVLLASGVLFVVISKIERLNTTVGMAILTLMCAIAHFLLLWSIRVNPDTVYAWQYGYISAIIHVYAVVLGVGLSVLQGSLCVAAHNSKRKSVWFDIGIITAAFCVFATLGVFLGIRVFQLGIAGGLGAICGAIAAIVIAALISIRRISQN